jgi:aspartate aminotransferase-like enzyme
MTFRIGLFGLEKLLNVDRTVDLLEGALEQVMPQALAQTV